MPTLLIKKKFLDKIKSGHKTIEYRDKTTFYDRLFKSRPKYIKFLCQHETHVVKVKDIKVMFGKYRIYL